MKRILLALAAFLAPAARAKHTCELTFPNAPATALANFPVLVRFSPGSLDGFSFSDCPGATNLWFTDSSGDALPFEADTWNDNGTNLVWVSVPSLSAATTITMHWTASGAPASPASSLVWSRAGYVGVWHMNKLLVDASTGTHYTPDSSASGWHAYKSVEADAVPEPVTTAPGVSTHPTPLTGTAMNIAYGEGSDLGGFRVPSTQTSSTTLNGPGFTLSAIVNSQQIGNNGRCRVIAFGNGYNDRANLSVGNDNIYCMGSDFHGKTNPKGATGWVYAADVFNSPLSKIYADGVCLSGSSEGSPSLASLQLDKGIGLGCFTDGQQCLDGYLDEARIRNAASTVEWLKAEYDSVIDPEAFASLGVVVSPDPDLPRFGALSASDANGTATFTVPLAEPGYGGEVPTAVSVFYGTDGETWTELSLGSTNGTATLTGSVSGLTAGVRYLWYAVATATQDGTPRTTTSQPQSFVARAFDPTGNYKSFTATVVWDGAPAENLPFLLRISEGGVNGFDYDDVTASGLEILDADGHLLPFEIDTWNPDGESLVWVLPPVYEDGATVTVRYGAPFANAPIPATNVWTAYVAVWHMNEILEDAESGDHYTPDSSASGWHAYKSVEEDAVPEPVTTAPGASAHPTPLTGTAIDIAYGTTKSMSDFGGFVVPASRTSSTTLNGPGFTLSAIVNSQQIGGNGRCRVIAFGNGYADKANLSVGTDNIYCMGSNYHEKTNPKGATGWVYAADVFNSPLSKIYADGVCLSGSSEGAPDLASLTLDKGIGLGCFTDGTQCLDGYLDEARIRNAASTADWIAAECHTMADGAVSFSSVSASDTSVPVLGTPSVARNANGSFTVSVEVSENTPASIACTIGGADYAMTPADASLPTTYSATVSGLAPGTYVASVHATATSGTSVSSTCPDAFHAGALAIVKISDADEGSLSPGVFRVSRADADSTGLPALTFDVAFSGPGLAAIADPGISTATIPAGAAYVDIAVTPIPNDAVNENLELVLTVSGAHVGQSSTASLTVVNSSFDLAVRYVATTGNDANSGGTPESPKKTIAAAVSAVSTIAPTRTCTVHVAPGLYAITSPIVVTNAVRILGDDPDPSRVVVSNIYSAGWGQNYRVFIINHADALVANLTMQKGSICSDWDEGANLFINGAGGTVSNCVVEAGEQRTNHANGGGASLGAGLVTHTVFRKNTAPNSSPYSPGGGNRAAVLHLYGSSRAENCLLVDNPQSTAVVLVRLADTALMRNCTIVDSALSKTSDVCRAFSAIRIDGSNASVVNTVIAGVTNKIDGAACPPTGTVANFVNGAFDGNATGLPAGTVTGTAAEFFRDYAASDYKIKYQPKSGGPLYNAGAEYPQMAAFDLTGVQPRKVSGHVDIGCYEGNAAGTMLLIK